jgi:hypothetical protein
MEKFTKHEWSSLRRTLVNGGCPVLEEEVPTIPRSGLRIEQLPCSPANMVFDLENGITGFVMDLEVTNESDHPVLIEGFEFKTPWQGAEVSLLAGPHRSGPKQGNFCFPDPGTLAFDGDIVLNRLFSSRERMRPGENASGLVLGIQKSPIPAYFPEYGRTFVEVRIFAARERQYSAKISLCVDRSLSCARERRQKSTVDRGGLVAE